MYIDHFRVVFCLCVKTSLRAKPFMRMCSAYSLIFRKNKLIFIKKENVLHEDTRKLGNGLLTLGNLVLITNTSFQQLILTNEPLPSSPEVSPPDFALRPSPYDAVTQRKTGHSSTQKILACFLRVQDVMTVCPPRLNEGAE